jgi:hypothetical protein
MVSKKKVHWLTPWRFTVIGNITFSHSSKSCYLGRYKLNELATHKNVIKTNKLETWDWAISRKQGLCHALLSVRRSMWGQSHARLLLYFFSNNYSLLHVVIESDDVQKSLMSYCTGCLACFVKTKWEDVDVCVKLQSDKDSMSVAVNDTELACHALLTDRVRFMRTSLKCKIAMVYRLWSHVNKH